MSAVRDDSVYLRHIVDACARIEEFLKDTSKSDFMKNEELQSAVLYQIQIVGEASKRLSEKLREDHPEIVWKKIVGMRDKIVHDYMGVDIDYAWQTAIEDVPAFKGMVINILENFS